MTQKDILLFELKLSVQAERNFYITYLHTDTDDPELLSKCIGPIEEGTP